MKHETGRQYQSQRKRDSDDNLSRTSEGKAKNEQRRPKNIFEEIKNN